MPKIRTKRACISARTPVATAVGFSVLIVLGTRHFYIISVIATIAQKVLVPPTVSENTVRSFTLAASTFVRMAAAIAFVFSARKLPAHSANA